MTVCEWCGIDGTFLFTCPDCSGHFCDEHRDLDAHECESLSDAPVADDQEPDTEESDAPSAKPLADTTRKSDEATVAPEPTTHAEAVQDEDDDSPDASEARGGLRRIPLLGRLFG